MSWLAAIPSLISAGSGLFSASKARKARSNLEGFNLPAYEEDKDYDDTQAVLKALGMNILEGDIPDFYSGIGKQGSDSFLDYLNLSNAKISESVLEGSAATGRRGGAVQSQIAEFVGENTTKLGYQDYLTALQGKKDLLHTGINITSGVRGAGQVRETAKNRFTRDVSGMDLDYRTVMDNADLTLGAAEGDAMSNLIDMAINATSGFGSKKTVGGSGNRRIKKGMVSGSTSGAYDSLLQLLKN